MAIHRYIAIEGVIGVGKTTLARLLQPTLAAQLLLEQFEENPFLADFYGDRAKYAFQTQIVFLLSRYRQQHRVIPRLLALGNVISDYMFAKDRIFAHVNLTGDELQTYERLHGILAENVVTPDLIVFLDADIPVIMERIAQRDRTFERSMDPAYLEALRQAYRDYLAEQTLAPALILNTNELNVLRSPHDLDYVEQRVLAALGLGTHQPALPQLGAETAGSAARPEAPTQPAPAPQPLSDDPFSALLRAQEQLGSLGGLLAHVWADYIPRAAQRGNQAEALEEALRGQESEVARRLGEAQRALRRLAAALEMDPDSPHEETLA